MHFVRQLASRRTRKNPIRTSERTNIDKAHGASAGTGVANPPTMPVGVGLGDVVGVGGTGVGVAVGVGGGGVFVGVGGIGVGVFVAVGVGGTGVVVVVAVAVGVGGGGVDVAVGVAWAKTRDEGNITAATAMAIRFLSIYSCNREFIFDNEPQYRTHRADCKVFEEDNETRSAVITSIEPCG